MFSFNWDYTCLLKNAGTIVLPPCATSLTRDSFVLTDVSSLGQEILSLGRSPDTAPRGATSLPHTARPASQVAGQAAPALLSQAIDAPVCFQRKGVSGAVSEWKYLHPQELCAGEKNKQGKMFQGNRGKARTKECEKGSWCAKGKQMQETLKPAGTLPLK